MSSVISETAARMTTKIVEGCSYDIVSHLDWEMFDVGAASMTSDEVQLMEFSEAYW